MRKIVRGRRRVQRSHEGHAPVPLELLHDGKIGPVAGEKDEHLNVAPIVQHVDGVHAQLDLRGVALEGGGDEARFHPLQVERALDVLAVSLQVAEVGVGRDQRRLRAVFLLQVAAQLVQHFRNQFVGMGTLVRTLREFIVQVLVVYEDSGALEGRVGVWIRISHHRL